MSFIDEVPGCYPTVATRDGGPVGAHQIYRSLTIPFGAGVGMMRTEKDFALTALVSGGSGDDVLTGDAGTDALRGEDGARLFGGNDTDDLSDGAEADVLTGGAGAFVLGGSNADVIALNGGAFADFAAVQAASRQEGADVVIAYGTGDGVTLRSVQLGSPTAASFVLA
ncbi:hypothetical protein [uncultured Methylobacterium sp.]|uniref:calcium-binding protein n=1 Tax=uncultured Methylobacterium sp. TaxID=157278 RepID=UPI0026057A05|nr:hypothetical protein [uncultured Methylobacterium sp.]